MAEETLTILLVEDSDLDLMIVQRLVRRLGLDLPIVRANNGEEALQILRTPQAPTELKPAYVILLDLNMPRMTGFEFLEAVGEDQALADVPIFILSTSNNPEDRNTARQYRIRGYIVKPITEPDLNVILASCG